MEVAHLCVNTGISWKTVVNIAQNNINTTRRDTFEKIHRNWLVILGFTPCSLLTAGNDLAHESWKKVFP